MASQQQLQNNSSTPPNNGPLTNHVAGQQHVVGQQVNHVSAQQLAAIQNQHMNATSAGARPAVINLNMQSAANQLQNVQVLGSVGVTNAINLNSTTGAAGAFTSTSGVMATNSPANHMQVAMQQASRTTTVPNAISAVNQQMHGQHQMRNNIVGSSNTAGASGSSATGATASAVNKRKLNDLLRELDPLETMDDDAEEVLLQLADDFIENIISSSCQIAKNRKSTTLDVKDVHLHLDRNWNMWIPGFGNEDLRPYKKLPSTDAHRQRLALIKKALKK